MILWMLLINMLSPTTNKVWSFGVYCEERRLDPTRVLKLVHDNYLTDINSSNGSEEDGMGKISTLTISQNGYEASTESQAAPNGGDNLQARRNLDPIASFKIQNNGIDHEMRVELQQEGDESEEEEMTVKREEVEVSSPMMIDKPKEMRPYSVALEVMFKRKEIKSKHRKMCLIALAVLLAVLLIGGIVAVLVVFVGDSGGSEPEPVAIQGEFRIANRDYSNAYSNPRSTEYKQLQQEFIDEMDNIYMNSTFKNIYINAKVSGFRKGSIVVAFVVQLKRIANENTGTGEDMDNDRGDNDTDQSDDGDQTNPMYLEARDFILISVNNGMLGQLEGTVINLTLIPGRGKPAETVTIPAVTSPKPTTTKAATTTTTTTTETTTSATTQMTTTSTSTTMRYTTAATTEDRTTTAATTMRYTTEAVTTDITRDDIIDGRPDSDSLSDSLSSAFSSDTNYCDTNPCMNGATCVHFLGSFCQCPSGFYGTLCESDIPPDPCDPNPCLNEGNCTTFLTTALCTCIDDFYGQYCQHAAMSVPSSSYDYMMYDSITPFPSLFPLPGAGGNVFDCEPIVIQECLEVLPYNKTTAPNPHGMGNTMTDIQANFDMLSVYINPECHPDGTRVLCSLLHTRCSGETVNLFMAFLNTYIPCKSLCLEVSKACGSGGPFDIDELCNSLPESADETICYRLPDATGPSSCTLNLCMNGGSCFTLMNQTMCRCVDGFIGERCQIESIDPCLSDPCQNQGECQPEMPQIPGMSLLYICICGTGYFGQHCEHKDMANVDVDSPVIDAAECGAELLIPECAELVPYNISHSAPIQGSQYAMIDWTSILNNAKQCHQHAAIFICSRIQRKCTYEGPILPCRALCERVVTSCNMASFSLPEMDCSTYSDSLNELDCFDMTYN